jgi:hypothetical protein
MVMKYPATNGNELWCDGGTRTPEKAVAGDPGLGKRPAQVTIAMQFCEVAHIVD